MQAHKIAMIKPAEHRPIKNLIDCIYKCLLVIKISRMKPCRVEKGIPANVEVMSQWPHPMHFLRSNIGFAICGRLGGSQ